MKKLSTGGGRPSMSSVPLRVRQENAEGGRASTSSVKGKGKSRSLGGLKTTAGGHRNSTFGFGAGAFLPKTGRPSSGIGVRGRTDVPKDPRPISDKKYINQSIKQLLEFLVSNTYPHPISHKLLVSPTSKDYFKIFSFIYGKLQPGYKMAPKMEDEVPRVLKLLGYPFSISKQYLYSVGSPHTWPNLLAALMWMIELLQLSASVNQSGIDAFIFGEDFDRKADDQIFLEYAVKTYDAFMKGQDTFPELDEELRYSLKQAYQGGENIEIVEDENARLEENLNMVAQEEANLHKLKEQLSNLKHDGRVLTQYLEELERCKKMALSELNECDESVKICDSDLAMEQSKLSEMQLVFQNQDLSQADVTRLKSDHTRLRGQVDVVEKQIEQIEADDWNVNIQQTKVNDEVQTLVANYNRLAIKLKLVPETAELANGRDFRLQAGCSFNLQGSFDSIIKPELHGMKTKYNENSRRKNKDKFQMQCELEKMEEELNEESERFKKKEKELSDIEAEISSLKQDFQSDKRLGSSEQETVIEDIQQLETERVDLKKALAEATIRVNDIERLLEDQKQVHQKDQNEIDEVRKKIQASLHSFKGRIEARMGEGVEKLKSRLKQEDQDLERLKEESVKRNARLEKLKEDYHKRNPSASK